MSSPVVEVDVLTLQPGMAAEPRIKAILEIISRQKGYLGSHWGSWEEVDNKIQLLVQWDAIASHMAFKSTPDKAAIHAMIRPILTGPSAMHHTHFDSSLPKVLKAPVTEITTFYSPIATFEQDIDGFLTALSKVDGCLGISKGVVVEELGEEKVRAYQVLIGWESIKAHEEAMKRAEVIAKAELAVDGARKVEMHHVKLIAA